MSDREITAIVKKFAQGRLRKEYGFAPALRDIEVLEVGYEAKDGMTIRDVYYTAIAINGKYYSIRWDSVDRLPRYDGI